jgi:hypothetical protein
MELAPFPDKIGVGCQGFIGPLPSAFLDKYLKNWRKGNSVSLKLPNNFLCDTSGSIS